MTLEGFWSPLWFEILRFVMPNNIRIERDAHYSVHLPVECATSTKGAMPSAGCNAHRNV